MTVGDDWKRGALLIRLELDVRKAWTDYDHALAAQKADLTYFDGRLRDECAQRVHVAARAVAEAKDALREALGQNTPSEDENRRNG